VGPVEVVVVLPLFEFEAEYVGVVDHFSFEETVELFLIDAVGSLHLAVEPWGLWSDVDMFDALVLDMPVEAGLELGTIVGLDRVNLERQLGECVVDELDCGVLPGCSGRRSAGPAVWCSRRWR